jgi:hypothetical protein
MQIDAHIYYDVYICIKYAYTYIFLDSLKKRISMYMDINICIYEIYIYIYMHINIYAINELINIFRYAKEEDLDVEGMTGLGLYMYIYICIYIYIYIYMFIYVYMFINICMCRYIYVDKT